MLSDVKQEYTARKEQLKENIKPKCENLSEDKDENSLEEKEIKIDNNEVNKLNLSLYKYDDEAVLKTLEFD
jgi:hypothetical protein